MNSSKLEWIHECDKLKKKKKPTQVKRYKRSTNRVKLHVVKYISSVSFWFLKYKYIMVKRTMTKKIILPNFSISYGPYPLLLYLVKS